MLEICNEIKHLELLSRWDWKKNLFKNKDFGQGMKVEDEMSA